jgi:hypothetical protein
VQRQKVDCCDVDVFCYVKTVGIKHSLTGQ